MPFKDWLDKYKPSEDGFDFEAFKADALKEFGTDEEVWTAKVSETEEKLTTAANDLKETKARNYDLLRQVPADKDKTPPEVEQPKELTIDDFFGERKKETV